MLGYIKMLKDGSNIIIFLIVLSMIIFLFSEGKKIGKLRGEIAVQKIKMEQLQISSKNFMQENEELQKNINDLQKKYDDLNTQYNSLQNDFVYSQTLKDTLYNRYTKLYKEYYGKRFDWKELKINTNKSKRKRR